VTVVFDLLGFQNRDHGERGIARYVLNLALAMERTNPRLVDRYLVHPHLPVPEGIEPLVATGKVRRADDPDQLISPTAGGVFVAGSVVELQEPLGRVFPSWARSPQWRTATILYDLIPLRFRDWYLTDPALRFGYEARVRAMASFDHLLAISEASARDAVEYLGTNRANVSVIWAGADDRFQRPTNGYHDVAKTMAAASFTRLQPGYVMFPSGIERRKNVDRLLEAYAALPPKLRDAHQLVLVCRVTDSERTELANRAAALGISNQLLVTGFVSDEELVGLYQGAELVVFPSLYEGFGLPVLEAMQCGAPVICSDSSSLSEVQQDSLARFDPNNAEAITEAIERALTDQDEMARLRSLPPPPYSWERSAEATAAAITDLQSSSRRRAPVKPRLGLITPLPPQRSGIATYAARLVAHLRETFDITVFVECDPAGINPIEGVYVEALRQLPVHANGGYGFDRLLYFIGNSTFHVDSLAMLAKHPGAVLLHDCRLTGLFGEVQRLRPDRLPAQSVGHKLSELYPNRYRPMVTDSPVVIPETAARFGVLMAGVITDTATEVFVHSEYAANLIDLDTRHRPEVLFDIPCPTPAAGPKPRVLAAPVIATFGMVAPVKCPELLIDALAKLAATVPDAKLVFAGEVDPPYRDVLEERAEELGIEDSVSFTGHVPDQKFKQLQQEAAIAVQLRSVTNGESSAAVSETLAVGLPTVVSKIGSMTELPPDVVVSYDHTTGVVGLADLLGSLLADRQRLTRLSESALQYAARNSFAAAARILSTRLLSY